MKKIILLSTILCLFISCGKRKAEKLKKIELLELSDKIAKMENSSRIYNLEKEISNLESEIRDLKYSNNNNELKREINSLSNYINYTIIPHLNTNQQRIDNNIENLNRRVDRVEFDLRFK